MLEHLFKLIPETEECTTEVKSFNLYVCDYACSKCAVIHENASIPVKDRSTCDQSLK